MTREVTITYMGRPLVLTGRHNEGYAGDRIDPPEEPSFEVYTATDCGVDVTALFSDDQLQALGDLALDTISTGDDFAYQEHCDRLLERHEEAVPC